MLYSYKNMEGREGIISTNLQLTACCKILSLQQAEQEQGNTEL